MDALNPTSWLASDAVRRLIELALTEDGVDRDITTKSTVPPEIHGVAHLVAKAAGVVAGLPLLADQSPLRAAFPAVRCEFFVSDGAQVAPRDRLATLRGPAHELLALERTALNFLQRMSGIATETSRYVDACRGTKARVQETRKTCPGHRILDKYAVQVGGGLTHRLGLHDQVLIKENHLIFAGEQRSPDAVRRAVLRARAAVPPGTVIEVEVETLDQLDAALDVAPDIVLLDNMSTGEHAEAVRRRNARGSATLLEVSGGVTLATAAEIARTGVDRMSVGALTHSVRALDLSFDLFPDPAA